MAHPYSPALDVDAAAAFQNFVIRVRLRMPTAFKLRCCIGVWLISLGCRVLPFGSAHVTVEE